VSCDVEHEEVAMSITCPMCHDEKLTRSEGRLDQSGESYLPTVVWRCARCEYTRFEPAVHAKWLSTVDAAEPTAEPIAPRRAA
jgi:rubredoxin